MNVPDESEQRTVRLDKVTRLDEEGVPSYRDFNLTHRINSLVTQYAWLSDEEHGYETEETISTAGRVIRVRKSGKLSFLVLQSGEGTQIQVIISKSDVGDDAYARFKTSVDIGDFWGVEGRMCTSLTGELSVKADSIVLISKALRPLPNLHHELNDETRVRSRYLDLITSEEARVTARTRSLLIRSLRRFLEDDDYLEIETPMLQNVQGGANARPFTTHSHAMNSDLFLRIAPELFLKRAVIGGLERVFEINRCFRNEGMDSTHSPEFTTIEFYEAYSDYRAMAIKTQNVITASVHAATGSSIVSLGEENIDLAISNSWHHVRVYDSLSDALGAPLSPLTSMSELQRLCQEYGVVLPDGVTHGKMIEELWEAVVLPQLGNTPTFVWDFPQDTSPLTRESSTPGIAEKWDLYINGMEIGTGYSELNDPIAQRANLTQQSLNKAEGDVEAMSVDEDFLTALEYAMPPTGGVGLGIDRFLMVMTGKGIRDTILFPLVKNF